MSFIKGLLAGFTVVLFVAFGMGACTKEEPVAVAPVVVAPVPNEVAVTPVAPTPALTAATPTVTSTKVAAHKQVTKSKYGSERAAYAKAKYNAALASCLRTLVDIKIDGDVKAGSYRDLGNVITSGVCQAKAKAAVARHKKPAAKK